MSYLIILLQTVVKDPEDCYEKVAFKKKKKIHKIFLTARSDHQKMRLKQV